MRVGARVEEGWGERWRVGRGARGGARGERGVEGGA